MSRPHAVPVWVKVSETPEVTGMGTVTEEERADGILRLEQESLVIEVEIVESTTRVGGMGTTTEKESLGTRVYGEANIRAQPRRIRHMGLPNTIRQAAAVSMPGRKAAPSSRASPT